MDDQLTLKLLLGALLVPSFACFGTLALWAATSPRHWFLRTSIVLVALSPFLMIPAYEPIVAFGLQAAIVTAFIFIYRRWVVRAKAKSQTDPPGNATSPRSVHFSLSSLLLATVVVAVTVPVITKFPQLNRDAWTSTIAIGVICGIATLIAAWMVTARRKWLAWPIGVIVCVGLNAALWGLDWFTYSMIKQGGWPPSGPIQSVYGMMGDSEPLVLVWFAILPATIATLIVLMLLGVIAFPAATSSAGRPHRRVPTRRLAMRIIFAAFILFLVAYPCFILWKLMHPLPVPSPQLPSPNGYDDFVAAGKTFLNGSPILNTSVEPQSTAELAAEVAKFETTFDLVRLGLSRPSQVPLWPADLSSIYLLDIQQLRTVARALTREAELAQQQSRHRDAAMISIDCVRLGHASSRGGLLIQYLVGIAIEGVGYSSLYPAIPLLDADACREAVTLLEQIERDREPLDQMFHRERIYGENVYGWFGHLQLLLNDAIYGFPEHFEAATNATSRSLAVSRLIVMEIALRRYFVEHGSYPSRLDELVPEYASAVPIDPFDVDGGPLRFKLAADGYVLYSLSYDRKDDGGRPSPRDSGLLESGDLRLDDWLAPWEEPEPEPDESTDAEVDESDIDAMDRTDVEVDAE
jgi:hypothetical protein